MRKWFAPQLSEANLKSVMKVVQKLAAGAGVEKAATPAEAEAKAEAAPAAAAKECATGS